MNLGPGSIILIALVALLIFGPKKLPELGKAAGNSCANSSQRLKDWQTMKTIIRKKANQDNV